MCRERQNDKEEGTGWYGQRLSCVCCNWGQDAAGQEEKQERSCRRCSFIIQNQQQRQKHLKPRLGFYHSNVPVASRRGRIQCLLLEKRSLTWSRSSGSVGAGLVTAPRTLLGTVAISNRKVLTTGEHQSGWRVTPGTGEDFARATAPRTAFWLRTQDPRQFTSGRAINHGTNKTSSKTSTQARSSRRATHLAVPGKRRRRVAMRMWKTIQMVPLRRKPQTGKKLWDLWKGIRYMQLLDENSLFAHRVVMNRLTEVLYWRRVDLH